MATAEGDKIAKRIAAYCKKHKMAPSRFGRDVANDPGLVAGIENGRSVGFALVERINAKLKGEVS